MTPAGPFVIVVTGSECTGKTTLARDLAARFDASRSDEYVRHYLDRKASPLDASDVDAIARGQVDGEDAAMAAGTRLVIKDTDLVSTAIYAHHYYGSCPDWIERVARERLGDLYLLLHPDVPWVADGLQRDRSAARDQLHRLFAQALAALDAHVVDITGDWPARLAQAVAAIHATLHR
jgi:NadR type nicotinamide-nucleotide adenylyltransferase